MGKTRNNQSGFSTVEIVLVVVVMGLVGVVGFMVYKNQSKMTTDTTSKSQVEGQKTKTESKTDPTATWLTYTSQNNKYSLAIPDGWQLQSTSGQDDLYAFNAKDIVFQDGVKANIDKTGSGGDGFVLWLVYDYKNNKNFDLSYQLGKSSKVKTYMTDNGISVMKYSRTQTAEPEGQDISKGTVQYTYDLSKNDTNAILTYDVRPGETDQSQYVEDSLATLKFL